MPSPERIALAHARNGWNDARRFPRDAATGFALLLFVGLMLLGFQFQMVTKLAEILGDRFQFVVNSLPVAAGAGALLMRGANPAYLRRTACGNWLESLPLGNKLRARWAIRQACWTASLFSLAGSLVLADAARLEGAEISIPVTTILLLWCAPVAVVLLRSVWQRQELLHPRETSAQTSTLRREGLLPRVILQRFNSALSRGLAGLALAETSSAALWLKLVATLVMTVGLIVMTVAQGNSALLFMGIVLAPLMMSSSLEPPTQRVYALCRSLPVSFRRITRASIKPVVLWPMLFGVPFVLAALFVPDRGYVFWFALLMLLGTAALMFLRLQVLLAFPHSKLSQILFTFAAALGVGVLTMQAPLVAPVIGFVLCSAWLWERGWGVWEFGYGERGQ